MYNKHLSQNSLSRILRSFIIETLSGDFFAVETLFNLVVEVLFHLCDLKIIQHCF